MYPLRRFAAVILVGLTAVAATTAAETYYETLEVAAAASATQIKRSYYKLAKSLHPDRVDDAVNRDVAQERFKRVGKAYGVLSDPAQRREYDSTLLLQRRARNSPRTNERGSLRHLSTPPYGKQQKPSPRKNPEHQPQQRRPQETQPGPNRLQAQRPQASQPSQQRLPQNVPPKPSAEDSSPHALARKRLHEVSSVEDLLELTDASDDGSINRHLLIAFYDSRDAACAPRLLGEQEPGVGFPYPFAHQSQAWYGVWWEDVLITASYDVSAALGPASGANTFGGADSPLHVLRAKLQPVLAKRTGAALLPACPLFGFHRMGSKLSAPPLLWEPLSAVPSAADLQKWVWAQLEVELTIRNELAETVRINWIHGSLVNELLTLGPKQATTQAVFLTHTLQAELPSRKGKAISENSSLAIFSVAGASAAFVVRPACVDLDSTCDFWRESGECARNEGFMRTECPRSCGLCPAEARPKPAPTNECFDANPGCGGWVASGECAANLAFMREACRLSCRLCAGASAAGHGTAAASSATAAALCADETRDCLIWTKAGECVSNKDFMAESCPRSCGLCDAPGGAAAEVAPCEDTRTECAKWKRAGQCAKNAAYMGESCARTCGLCAAAPAAAAKAGKAAAGACVDGKPQCAAWAEGGQCARNYGFMKEHCRLACRFCEAPCDDLAGECAQWAADGQCERNWGFMRKTCRRACGACGGGGPECWDAQMACADWARGGECESNAEFMAKECALACKRCRPGRREQAAAAPEARSQQRQPEQRQPAQAQRGPAGGEAADRPCADDIANCAAILKGSHTACQAPLMKSSCARTCGVCGGQQAAAERTQGGQMPKAGQQQTRATGETQQAARQGGRQSVPCVDTIPNCAGIVAKTPGACQTAPVVKTSCRKACGLCGGGGRKDEL